MTRKQWINSLDSMECIKILHVFPSIFKDEKASRDATEFKNGVRSYIRKNKITVKMINVQYGRLAAGLSILPLNKLK